MGQIKNNKGLQRAELKIEKFCYYTDLKSFKQYKRLVKLINRAYKKGFVQK